MITLDDLEVNFEAGVEALTVEAARRIEEETVGMTDGQLLAWRVLSASEHLARLHACDAPEFLIRGAFKRQRKRLRALQMHSRAEARSIRAAGHQEKST